MKNRFVLSVLLFVITSGLVWAQFWNGYSDAERHKVGEAYWLAGKQYTSIGKAKKGDEYMTLARIIFPDLDPSSIKDESLPSAAELLAQGRTTAIGGGAETLPTGSLNSFFLRFVNALTEKDTAGVAGFLDGTIYLSAQASAVTAEEFTAFFAETPLRGKEPSTLYDLTSLVVARASQAQGKAWGETYSLTVNASADLSDLVSVWGATQHFLIHRQTGGWSLFSYGPTPPPLTWKPEPAASEGATEPAAASLEADTSKALIDTFTSCMTAILDKDADGALALMSQNIRFLRLRQSVTREELKTSLLGFFDKPGFNDVALADVLDMDSIFVHSVASPVEDVTDTVYELNVQAKEDLSSFISFWTTYQKYYYVQEDGEWVIFAIL